MKQFIEYYYNLINITLHKKDNTYYFYCKNNKYCLTETTRTLEEVNAIYKLLLYDKKYNKIILNINKLPISIYNNKKYILIKIQYDENNINSLYYEQAIVTKENYILLRNNWPNLISKKIDYIEYQMEHIRKKYKILSSSVDYYIGMAENSISYVKTIQLSEKESVEDRLYICHKRINSLSLNDYYNPLNIIIDHKVRDISEYLKYLFLNDQYNLSILNDTFNSFNLSSYEYRMLYARMVYPSFYFDIYEKIVNLKVNEEEIIKIIKRTDEYEKYINEIYKLINKKIKIPKIDWV